MWRRAAQTRANQKVPVQHRFVQTVPESHWSSPALAQTAAEENEFGRDKMETPTTKTKQNSANTRWPLQPETRRTKPPLQVCTFALSSAKKQGLKQTRTNFFQNTIAREFGVLMAE